MHVAVADDTRATPSACDRVYQCTSDVDVNGNEASLLMGIVDSRLPADDAARVSKKFSALESARALYNLESSPAQSPRRKPLRRPLSAYASPLIANYAQSTDGSSHPSSLESLAVAQHSNRSRTRRRGAGNAHGINSEQLHRRHARSLSSRARRSACDNRIVCSDGELNEFERDEMIATCSDDDLLGPSTSASDDSFEMPAINNNNSCVLSQEPPSLSHVSCHSTALTNTIQSLEPVVEEEEQCVINSGAATLRHNKSSTISPSVTMLTDSGRDTDTNTSASLRRDASIDNNIAAIDTRMPEFDFAQLERQLSSAAAERDRQQRRIMSEEVRRRLAAEEEDDGTTAQSSAVRSSSTLRSSRHLRKSNLAQRLQRSKELQVCYVNDTRLYHNNRRVTADDDFDEDETSSGDETSVPKSRSTPADMSQSLRSAHVGTSMSCTYTVHNISDTLSDSDCLSARELQRQQPHVANEHDRLQQETLFMLRKAREAAIMQVRIEREARQQQTKVEQIVGVSLRRKISRAQLSKMCLTQLQLIYNDMHDKIEKLNEHLMRLLVKRDQLHMEQDSILVDVEDQLKHRARTDLPLAAYLLYSESEQRQRRDASSSNSVQSMQDNARRALNHMLSFNRR